MNFARALACVLALSSAAHAGEGDPPVRVARLTVARGDPSVRYEGESAWRAAQTNLPFATGASVWTPEGAGITVALPGIRLVSDQLTEFRLDALTDTSATLTLPQGRLFLDLRFMAAGQAMTVHTPRGDAVFGQPGAYEADAGSTDAPTRVAVVDGSAAVSAPDVNLTIPAGQEADVIGEAPLTVSVAPLARDAFLSAMLAEDRPRPVASVAPPVVAAMTGGEDLAAAGSWVASPQYGQVWVPPQADFVPYRAGHWANVPPWGWTWVDNAPWGYATTHYGRWAAYERGWCWIPGPVPEREPFPVWAPAVVGFVSVGAAIGIVEGPPVAWVPLGPGERFRPYWRASARYDERLNRDFRGDRVTTVINENRTIVTNVTNNRTFVNRGAITVVPAGVVVSGAPVAAVARGAERFQQASVLAAIAPATRPVAPALVRPAPPAPQFQGLFSPRVETIGQAAPAAAAVPGFRPVQAEPSGRPELRGPGAVPPGISPRVMAGRPPEIVRPGFSQGRPDPVLRGSALGGPVLGGPAQGGPALGGPRGASPEAGPRTEYPRTEILRQPVARPAGVMRPEPPRPASQPPRNAPQAFRAAPQPFRPAPPRFEAPPANRPPSARVAVAAARPQAAAQPQPQARGAGRP